MKAKIFRLLFLSILLIALSFMSLGPAPAAGQSADPTPVPEETETTEAGYDPDLEVSEPFTFDKVFLEGPDVYTFRSLGRNDVVLNGPYDSSRIRFRLPMNWVLTEGTKVQLHINNVFTTFVDSESEIIQATAATLDIQFNNRWLTTIVLNWTGPRLVTIPIPPDLLEPVDTGPNVLSLSLNAAADCKFQHKTSVVILSDSRFDLQHANELPKVDLTRLPEPIYQPYSFTPNTSTDTAKPSKAGASLPVPSVVLVVPDQPSPGELQAALTASAGLGRMTYGSIAIDTLRAGDLSEEILKSSHIVYVGKGEEKGVLSKVQMPVQYDGAAFNYPDARPEDGIIQAAISPWENSKIIVEIRGASDGGIVKAAQAFSSGKIRVRDRQDLSIVSEITPPAPVTSVSEERTLASLGYSTVQLNSPSFNSADDFDFLFHIPPGMAAKEPAYFDIGFTNSPVIDRNMSGLTVLLNDKIIGGITYTEESSKSVVTERINLPVNLLRVGLNKLTVESDNYPELYCSSTVQSNLWTTVSDQSVIHIALGPAELKTVTQSNLTNYMDYLTSSSTLDSVAFVVAPGSSAAIQAAAKVAFEMGAQMKGDLVEFAAIYADQPTEAIRQDHELVLVGRATGIALVKALREDLPAPFQDNSDVADESAFRVLYRMPPEISVGYIQLLQSPWNPSRMILGVLGTTDEGLQFAAKALSDPFLKGELGGNFAVVQNNQVAYSDTRLGSGTGNITAALVPEAPAEIPATQVAPFMIEEVPFGNQTGWIPLAISITSLLTVAVLIIVLLRARRSQ